MQAHFREGPAVAPDSLGDWPVESTELSLGRFDVGELAFEDDPRREQHRVGLGSAGAVVVGEGEPGAEEDSITELNLQQVLERSLEPQAPALD